MNSTEWKDHQLGVNIVCQYLQKEGATIQSANATLGQHPQVVAVVDGQLHFVEVKTVRFPGDPVLDDAIRRQLLDHAAKHDAIAAFAPVGLWPTGDRDADGNEGFHVKYEGIQAVPEL